MTNQIIDIYHGNSIDFQTVRNSGVVAIIHKATQGVSMRDSTYHQRRQTARQMGFLWGSYHFSTGQSISSQVENYLEHAQPQDDELICLDWEPSPGPDMTLAQVRQFVQMIKNETGRWPVLYGGHLIREQIGHNPDSVLANCPLWYVRYANSPIGIPTQVWPTYTLWQYTDGQVGPEPRATPGCSGADRNIFQGSEAQLSAAWPFTRREGGAAPGPGFNAILGASPSFDLAAFRQFIQSLNLRHFSADEFLTKGSAHSNPDSPAFGLNTDPPTELWPNITKTARVVDELRERLGAPMTLSSVYRSPAYNAAIAGAGGSQHKNFNACDFVVHGKGAPADWAAMLRQMRSEGVFSGGIGTYSSFVHVDTRGHDANW